jgi:hypothetical protein
VPIPVKIMSTNFRSGPPNRPQELCGRYDDDADLVEANPFIRRPDGLVVVARVGTLVFIWAVVIGLALFVLDYARKRPPKVFMTPARTVVNPR